MKVEKVFKKVDKTPFNHIKAGQFFINDQVHNHLWLKVHELEGRNCFDLNEEKFNGYLNCCGHSFEVVKSVEIKYESN